MIFCKKIILGFFSVLMIVTDYSFIFRHCIGYIIQLNPTNTDKYQSLKKADVAFVEEANEKKMSSLKK